MATAQINLLTILSFITSISGKIPQAMKLLQALWELFAPEIAAAAPSGGLDVVELSAAETEKVEQITQALSAEGTQGMFDLTKLRQMVAWVNKIKDSPLGKILIALFGSGLAV